VKVLIVNDYAAALGGAEVGVLNLRDALRRRGHDARLFASTAGGGRGDYSCLGTTTAARTLLQTWNPWARRALDRALREFEPDLVHVYMFLTQLSPAILSALRGRPCLLYVVWYRPICPTGTKWLPEGRECTSPAGAVCYSSGCLPLRDWPLLMLQHRAWLRQRQVFDAVLANSEATARRLRADGMACDAALHAGIPEMPARPPLRDPPTAAFAGRLVREKGVDVLLRAFARSLQRVPEARLLVFGTGPEERNLVALAGKLGLGRALSIRGRVDHTRMDAVLAGAWVQVVPSLWAEPYGRVALEAHMRGTAVIATKGGGLEEIVSDGVTGRLVLPGDVEALAEALATLLQDRDEAERLGAEGRRRACSELSEGAFLDRLERIYADLLARKRTA
jgi:glycosyltransferase involved in cell wall biosynthesis